MARSIRASSGVFAIALMAFATFVAPVSSTQLVSYSFTNIDVPGALITFAFGLTNSGSQIVGAYVDPSFSRHGWVADAGTFSTVDFPGADSTDLNANNDRGQISGDYIDANGSEHGFVLSDGIFSAVDFPGASNTEADGINNSSQLVGGYGDFVGSIFEHGFLLSRGVFTSIDLPGAAGTWASAINDEGQIVGTYLDTAGIHHGFLRSREGFATFDFPGAVHTLGYGINNKGQIVGRYVTDANVFRGSAQHAFLLSSGSFFNVDPPGWTGRAIAVDINNDGKIVGLYRDANLRRHGFLAVPVRGSD